MASALGARDMQFSVGSVTDRHSDDAGDVLRFICSMNLCSQGLLQGLDKLRVGVQRRKGVWVYPHVVVQNLQCTALLFVKYFA